MAKLADLFSAGDLACPPFMAKNQHQLLLCQGPCQPYTNYHQQHPDAS